MANEFIICGCNSTHARNPSMDFFVRDDPNIAVRKTLHFCNETEGVSPYREEKKKITEGKRN
jgi:hypothetical protein